MKLWQIIRWGSFLSLCTYPCLCVCHQAASSQGTMNPDQGGELLKAYKHCCAQDLPHTTLKQFLNSIGLPVQDYNPMFTSMWFCFAVDKGFKNADFTNFSLQRWDEATANLKRETNDIAPHPALVAQRVRKQLKKVKVTWAHVDISCVLRPAHFLDISCVLKTTNVHFAKYFRFPILPYLLLPPSMPPYPEYTPITLVYPIPYPHNIPCNPITLYPSSLILYTPRSPKLNGTHATPFPDST